MFGRTSDAATVLYGIDYEVLISKSDVLLRFSRLHVFRSFPMQWLRVYGCTYARRVLCHGPSTMRS